GDDRAQQAHPADLPCVAQVAGEHCRQDDAVDDHRFGELRDHDVLPWSSAALLLPLRSPFGRGGESEHAVIPGMTRTGTAWYRGVPGVGTRLAAYQVGNGKGQLDGLFQFQDGAVHGMQAVRGRRGVEVELADLPDVIFLVEDDNQVKRDSRGRVLRLLVHQVFPGRGRRGDLDDEDRVLGGGFPRGIVNALVDGDIRTAEREPWNPPQDDVHVRFDRQARAHRWSRVLPG